MEAKRAMLVSLCICRSKYCVCVFAIASRSGSAMPIYEAGQISKSSGKFRWSLVHEGQRRGCAMASCNRERVILFTLGLVVGSYLTFSIPDFDVHDVAASKRVIEHLRSGNRFRGICMCSRVRVSVCMAIH